MNNTIKRKYSFLVIKNELGFFRSTWREWDAHVNNYEFTNNPNEASVFDGFEDIVPEQIWNEDNVPIETIQELCEFLNGALVKIEVREKIEWREVQVKEKER